MRRSVIDVSPAGISQLQTIANELGPDSELAHRLGGVDPAALAENNTITLELSEDTAELVLDRLPMPQADEAAQITTLRQQFQTFLAGMRHVG